MCCMFVVKVVSELCLFSTCAAHLWIASLPVMVNSWEDITAYSSSHTKNLELLPIISASSSS